MNSWIRGLSLFGLSVLTLISLSACESSEDRTLASAQSCLDGATTESQASECVETVKGLETQEAYLVRCSAAFIANGFSGEKIAEAYLTLSESDSDTMVGIMAYLNFSSTNENFTAEAATTNCEKSGVRSMYQLASAASLSTSITTLAGVTIDWNDPVGSIENAISDLNTNISSYTDDELAELGDVALVANEAFCTGTDSSTYGDICETLGNAISVAGGDSADIATQLLSLLN